MSPRKRPFSEFPHPARMISYPAPSGPQNDQQRQLVNQASFHETNRDRIVSELLFHMHRMAASKEIGLNRSSIVTVGAAGYHERSSSGNNEAAHCAPGLIRIGGLDPGSYMLTMTQKEPGKKFVVGALQAASRFRSLFTYTDDLHRNFNKSDSRAERYGMRVALLEASKWVIRVGIDRRRFSMDAIEEGFELYQQLSNDAYQEALKRLTYKISARDDLDNSKRQLDITEIYRETLKTSETRINPSKAYLYAVCAPIDDMSPRIDLSEPT